MFYSQVILSRKGPLGKIWLAAHFDKRLTKQQIFSTDISDAVESVMHPSVPLALRLSGQLMLGIVRIYSRKVKYLVTDCTEAMWKMRLAFRPANVDIDPTTLVVAIDDLRHFGHIHLEEEGGAAYEQLAFSAKDATDLILRTLPSPIPAGLPRRMEEARVRDMRGRVSELELLRGESPLTMQAPSSRAPSLLPSMPPSRETRLSVLAPFEGDLPAFEPGMLPLDEYSYSFSVPPMPSAAPTPAEALPLPYAEELPFSHPEVERAGVRKRVRIDEHVELSEKALKQRRDNTTIILRRPIEEPLSFRLPPALPGVAAALSPDQRIISLPYFAYLCPELRRTVELCTNTTPLPFPLRDPVPSPEGPPAAPITPAPPSPTIEFPRRATEESKEARGRVSALPTPRGSLLGYPPVVPEESFISATPSVSLEMPIAYEYQEQPPVETYVSRRDAVRKAMAKSTEGVSVVQGQTMTDRTRSVYDLLTSEISSSLDEIVSFDEQSRYCSRRSAAGFFLEILQLKTWGRIELDQPVPYGDISINVS